MQLFGTSGIRRLVDRNFLKLAFEVGLAAGKIYNPVVVGRDTRTSGDAMRHAVTAGILASGSRCADAGILPTPTLAWAGRDYALGLMLTASHNPPEYNGIKMLNPDGSALDAAQREQIEKQLDAPGNVVWSDMGQGNLCPDAIERHMERILKDFPGKFKLKVVLDCGCAAASVISPYLLRRLGCEVLALNCYPSGFFPHPIEPLESNLSDLIKVTRDFGADLGIAHDGDADRMMAVDDKGRFIPGDKLLAILARSLRAKEVVTTLDASMALDELGFKVRRTKIGDIYVSDELKKRSGDFGGEASGAWVFPGVSFCPDGIYAAAQMVAIAGQNKLSTLVDEIPSYPIRRGSPSSEGIDLSRLEEKLAALAPLSLSNMDGVRLGFKDGWLLVRSSGTEPKIRLTAEARSEARVNQLYESGLKAIEACRSK